jgi:hypothetical protein
LSLSKKGAFYGNNGLWYHNNVKPVKFVLTKGIIMMKRQTSTVLAGFMIASLVCSNAPVKASNGDGLVAGLCLGAAALLGVAGTVAWCCSETDDQMIARIDAQCRDISGCYQEDMMYAERLIRMHDISESMLHEFSTHVWNKNVTQHDYRVSVVTAKVNLQSSVETLRKRVNKLGRKSLDYTDQQRLRRMRQVLKSAEELVSHVIRFADILEAHRDYFNLYDTIDIMRTRYFHEITILESNSYSTEMEIKRSIINRDNGHYAFRTFVINIKSDMSALESKIYALKHTYSAKRQYAQMLVNYLITIKNIVVNDPRYQQELYEWEQAELQRARLEAERARARAEQDRAQAEHNRAWAEQRKADAMRENNRIQKERNQIERERLWNERQCDNADVNLNIKVII